MKLKCLLISIGITSFEFIVFLVWGLNMHAGDAMGFGLITTYFLFPLTTLILSAYLGYENLIMLIPFVPIMFAAQNFMPFLVFGSFEFVLILCLTLIPAFIGAITGMLIKRHKK